MFPPFCSLSLSLSQEIDAQNIYCLPDRPDAYLFVDMSSSVSTCPVHFATTSFDTEAFNIDDLDPASCLSPTLGFNKSTFRLGFNKSTPEGK